MKDVTPPLTLRARRWGHVLEAGPLYVHVRRSNHTAGASLGLDLSLRDVRDAPWLLLRAMLTEFLGAVALLFFSITTIVYREAYVRRSARWRSARALRTSHCMTCAAGGTITPSTSASQARHCKNTMHACDARTSRLSIFNSGVRAQIRKS